MNLSEKIKKARAAKGLSQKELAEAVGISERTIQNYELGARLPKKHATYEKLASVLNVSVASLMNDEESFVVHVSETFGSSGRRQAEDIIRNFRVAAAGGELDDDDLDFIRDAMIQTYYDAKAYNQRFRNRKPSSSEEDN